MLSKPNINSKKYLNIASRKSKKREKVKLTMKTSKKQLNISSQDEKLIYAFFLDIA